MTASEPSHCQHRAARRESGQRWRRFLTAARLAGASCALLLGAAAAAPGSSPLPLSTAAGEGFSAARLERLAGFARGLVDADHYLGVVTLVARNGKIVDWRAHGYRDLGKTQALAPDAIFRIYSMTKPVTSVAVLALMEEGRLGLDDPLAKFIPEFATMQVVAGGSVEAAQLRPASGPITIRHLLTHTGGFATGGHNEVAARLFKRIDLRRSPTLQAYAAQVARQALADDPGKRFAYDGVSLELLSRVVEVVAAMPFDAFLQQRILVPLQMQDTGFSVPAGKRSRIVDMVSTDAEGRRVIAATPDAIHPGEALRNYPSGAGGLYSSAGDYLRFCQMLLNGGSLDGVTILGRKSVELMMLNHLDGAELAAGSLRPGEGFGLGGYVVLDVGRRGRLGSVGQFGWSGAGSTYFSIDRQEKLIAMLLMQHLPQGLPKDPPKVAARFYDVVYQALVD